MPWVEIGDANPAQIISERSDSFWNAVDAENITEAIACMPARNQEQLMQQINSMLNIKDDISSIESQISDLDDRVTVLEETTFAGTHIGPNTPTDNSNLWVDTDD